MPISRASAARISCCHDARRHIARDDAARSDGGARADRHAGQHDHTAAQPDVFADGDRFGRFEPALSLPRLDRVRRRQQLQIRPRHHAATKADRRAVEQHTAEVEKYAVLQLDVLAIVAMERRLDPDTLAAVSQQSAQQRLARLALLRQCRVVARRQFARPGLPPSEVGVERRIEQPGEHAVALSHRDRWRLREFVHRPLASRREVRLSLACRSASGVSRKHCPPLPRKSAPAAYFPPDLIRLRFLLQ